MFKAHSFTWEGSSFEATWTTPQVLWWEVAATWLEDLFFFYPFSERLLQPPTTVI